MQLKEGDPNHGKAWGIMWWNGKRQMRSWSVFDHSSSSDSDANARGLDLRNPNKTKKIIIIKCHFSSGKQKSVREEEIRSPLKPQWRLLGQEEAGGAGGAAAATSKTP